MWIKYKIRANPTKKDFEEITKIIAINNYNGQEIESVITYCKSKNPRFNKDIFYNAIETKKAMLNNV